MNKGINKQGEQQGTQMTQGINQQWQQARGTNDLRNQSTMTTSKGHKWLNESINKYNKKGAQST